MKRSAKTLIAGLLLLMATPAAAGLSLSLDLAGNFSQPADGSPGAPDHPAKPGLGGGAELELPLTGSWDLDFGAFYLQRRYGTGSGSPDDPTTTLAGFEFPILVRYWIGDVVSFGAGPYYFDYTSTAAQQSTSDFGAVASLRFDFPIGIMTGVVLDGRYAYGLKNNSDTGDLKYRDLTAIIGLRFGWMK